jgi:hypothetical protein
MNSINETRKPANESKDLKNESTTMMDSLLNSPFSASALIGFKGRCEDEEMAVALNILNEMIRQTGEIQCEMERGEI